MEMSNSYSNNYLLDSVFLAHGIVLINMIVSFVLCSSLLAAIVRMLPTVVLGIKPSFSVAFRANLVAGIAVFLFQMATGVLLDFTFRIEPETLFNSMFEGPFALTVLSVAVLVVVPVAIWATSLWGFLKGPDGQRLSVVRTVAVAGIFHILWIFSVFILAGSLGYLAMILLT